MRKPDHELEFLQFYLRENARLQYDAVACPPFTLFFHPNDSFPFFSYAIPDSPQVQGAEKAIDRLLTEFHQRGRVPRFEFFEAYAPELPQILLQYGFTEEHRQWSMCCTAPSLVNIDPIPDLSILKVDSNSPLQDVFEFILAQRQGFNPTDTSLPGESAIAQARTDFSSGGWTGFLARFQGEPAAVATYGRIINGVTELAGIATRPQYRRKGIASFLTYSATREAFHQGAHLAVLTAEDHAAGRVYQRSGYTPFSVMLSFQYGSQNNEQSLSA
jgi:GNAT superfamily N-acetyltransferase